MSGEEEKHPFWGKCGACNHCWPICYVPMEVNLAAKLMKAAACPKCGEKKKIYPAKQNNGELLEPAA